MCKKEKTMEIKIFISYILIGIILSIFGCAKASIDPRAEILDVVVALVIVTFLWPAFFVVGLFNVIKELKEKR